MFDGLFDGAEVISVYTRAQAIADGVLVDVSDAARQLGIRFPVAMTEAAWMRYVAVGDGDGADQSESGRLHDVLYMFRHAMVRCEGSEMTFSLYVAKNGASNTLLANEAAPERGSGFRLARHRLVTLAAVCGPGDDAEPVITIMMPGED